MENLSIKHGSKFFKVPLLKSKLYLQIEFFGKNEYGKRIQNHYLPQFDHISGKPL